MPTSLLSHGPGPGMHKSQLLSPLCWTGPSITTLPDPWPRVALPAAHPVVPAPLTLLVSPALAAV